jgi:hypothetical protein
MTDLDPLLHDAMARVRGPVDARPSMTDVRRRARRHNRRRMTATVGVVACTGVATAALIIRRDSSGESGVASAPVDGDAAVGIPTSTVLLPSDAPTTTSFGLPALTITPSAVWDALFNARYDPSGVGLVVAPADHEAANVMPTAERFGCTSPECRAMFNYVVWHEIAAQLGFSSVRQMQDTNPALDLGQPPREGDVVQSIFGQAAGTVPTTIDPSNVTPTTISLFDGVVLIDAGAPAGAMDDAFQRLPGYNRVIVPGSGKAAEQTMVMPIGGNDALASGVGGVFGIDALDTWDPSFSGTQIQAMVAVVIGPDYFDRVQSESTVTTFSLTTTSLFG